MESNSLFVGRLGVNPEIKYTPKKKAVCELSVAVKHKEGHTIWKKVVVWGSQAESCSLYLKKGYLVFVEGVSEMREYTNKSGVTKSYDQVTANLIGFPNL